jgi:hypothetical protein
MGPSKARKGHDKLVEVEAKPFRKIISFYENEKASLPNTSA